MTIKNYLWKILSIFNLLFIIQFLFSQEVEHILPPGTTFYAGFDETLIPEKAVGLKTPHIEPSDAIFTQDDFVDGIKNKAVLIQFGKRLMYKRADNLPREEGTIAFWMKNIGWIPDGKDENFYIIFQCRGMNIYRTPRSPNITVYVYSRREGETKTAVLYGKVNWKKEEWHHIAVSWKETAKEEKKGEGRLFIDGLLVSEKKDVLFWNESQGGDYFSIGAIHGDWKPVPSTPYMAVDEFYILNRALGEEEINKFFDIKKRKAIKIEGLPYIPGKQDTDGDGIDDATEISNFTNPFEVDTSGDGIPDSKSFNPLVRKDVKKTPKAEVKNIGGFPTFVIDGVPYTPPGYATGSTIVGDRFRILGQQGINLVGFCFYLPEPHNRNSSYLNLTASLDRIIEEIPDAYIILRVVIHRPSPTFAEKFPYDLQYFADGSPEFPEYLTQTYGYNKVWSWASEAWKAITAGELVRLINYIRATPPYNKHVIGIVIMAGNTGEWWYFNDFTRHRASYDYSPAMLQAFKKYAIEKYKTVEKLNQAWKENLTSFEEITLPTPEEKDRFTPYHYLNPDTSQKVIDYWFVHNKVLTEKALYFAKVCKLASENNWLVGLEFEGSGYTELWNGKCLTRPLIASPDIDFFAAPSFYQNRQPGGADQIRIAHTSLILNNKVWFNESDFRTHLSPGKGRYYNQGMDTLKDTLEVFKRHFGFITTLGVHMYWAENELGSFEDPNLLSLFGKQHFISMMSSCLKSFSTAEICVVYSEKSVLLSRSGCHRDYEFIRYSLARIGAPYDILEINDLISLPSPHYKMYIFTRVGCLDNKEREFIKNKLAKDGRYIIWMGVPGLINPDSQPSLSEKNVKDLIGMEVEGIRIDAPREKITLTDEARKLLQCDDEFMYDYDKLEVPPNRYWWDEYKRSQFFNYFSLKNPDVILGTFKDGKCGFGLKKFGSWTSIYASGNNISPNILRGIAKLAGVHIYNKENDFFFANSHFMVVHTRDGGKKEFYLKKPSYVYELYDDREIGKEITKFSENIPEKTTRFYYIGSYKEFISAMEKAKDRLQKEISSRKKLRKELDEKRAIEFQKKMEKVLKEGVPLSEDGFLRDFLVLGEFVLEDLMPENIKEERNVPIWREKMNKWVFGPEFLLYGNQETNLVPVINDKVTIGNQERKWRLITGKKGTWFTEGELGFSSPKAKLYYIGFYLTVDRNITLKMKLKVDDTAQLFVDGKPMENLTYLGQEQVYTFPMEKGIHCIILKILDHGSPTGFSLQITDEKGVPLKNALIFLKR